jgi:hypothetical protein
MIALLIGYESLNRFFSPVPIAFNQAIPIAVVGLGINLLSAFLLREDDHITLILTIMIMSSAEIIKSLAELTKCFVCLPAPAQRNRIRRSLAERGGEVTNCVLVFSDCQVQAATIEMAVGQIRLLIERDRVVDKNVVIMTKFKIRQPSIAIGKREVRPLGEVRDCIFKAPRFNKIGLQEEGTKGPTMKQKVRFILKSRGQSKSVSEAPEQTGLI